MQDQLKLLEELQAFDLQLKETEDKLAGLPARLQSMKDDVGSVEQLLEGERQQLAEVQAYRAELDESIKNEQAQLGKAKAKLTQVKTSKEYMAVQREFETNRRLTGEREQEVAKLNQAIEQTQQSIEKHEGELQELRGHVEEEERETRARLVELEKKAETQRAERQVTTQRITKSLLRKYDQILRMRGGLAVVQALDGVCTGCRMQLAPQLYNMLQRSDTIEQCPTCQRIVYFKKHEDDDVQDVPSGSPPVDVTQDAVAPTRAPE